MVLVLLESKADFEHKWGGRLVCHEQAFLSLYCFDLQEFLTWILKHLILYVFLAIKYIN